jgi:hypothetical protein
MTISPSSAAPVARYAIRLILCWSFLHISFADDRAQAVSSVAATLRISTSATVAKSCGNTLHPPILQQAADDRLHNEGFSLSNPYNAQLVLDVDCVPVKQDSRVAGMVAYACLNLSELVSAPSDGKSQLATTWRKCQSFTLTDQRGDAAVRAGLGQLMTSFLEDLQTRTANAIAVSRTAPEPPEIGDPNMARKVFFLSYIMACVMVMFIWHRRSRIAARAEAA